MEYQTHKRHAFSSFQRAVAADQVLQRLPAAQRSAILSGRLDPALVTFKPARKGVPLHERMSILGQVHRHLCTIDTQYADNFDQSSKARASARRCIQNWFVHVFRIDNCSRSVEDASRAPKCAVGDELSSSQWATLLNVLISERWVDDDSNSRRFKSLSHFRDWLSSSISARKKGKHPRRAELADLDAIYEQSRAKSWTGLHDKVVARFGLVSEREVFKCTRNREMAAENAKRLLGLQPMVDVYRTKCHNQKRISSCLQLKRALQQDEGGDGGAPTSKRTRTESVTFRKEWFQACSTRLCATARERVFLHRVRAWCLVYFLLSLLAASFTFCKWIT